MVTTVNTGRINYLIYNHSEITAVSICRVIFLFFSAKCVVLRCINNIIWILAFSFKTKWFFFCLWKHWFTSLKLICVSNMVNLFFQGYINIIEYYNLFVSKHSENWQMYFGSVFLSKTSGCQAIHWFYFAQIPPS